MRATYYISFDNWSTQTQIYPSNSPKVKSGIEPGEIFQRARVDSFTITATKNSSVYTSIKSYFDTPDLSSQIYFKIVSDVTYNFKAPVSDGKLNTETKVYTVSPEPDDSYRAILDVYKRKITFNSISGDTYYPLIENTTTFTNAGFDTFTESARHINISEAGGGSTSKIKQEITALTTASGMKVKIHIASLTSNETLTLRLENSGGTALSADTSVVSSGFYVLTYSLAVGVTNCSLIIEGPAGTTAEFDYITYGLDQSFPRGSQTLESFIQSILTAHSISNTLISTYLWNDAVSSDCPSSISTYIGSNPTYDYVLGSTAIWNNLHVMRKDQLLGATTADIKLSLEDVMNLLKIKLRAWWYIDADGDFRIEHEKYFRSFTSQLNLTTGAYPAMKPETDHKIYTFNKGEIYSQLNYKEQDEAGYFIAHPIEYDTTKTTNKTKDINIDLTCDVQNAYLNPDSSSDSGICLMHGTTVSGVFYVGVISTDTNEWTANYYLSWEYLFLNYWGYFGEADEADINSGTTLTHDSVKEFLEQEDVKFYYAGALDWKSPVTLSNGTGWLRSWEHDPATGWYNINVGYNPYL